MSRRENFGRQGMSTNLIPLGRTVVSLDAIGRRQN